LIKKEKPKKEKEKEFIKVGKREITREDGTDGGGG
jgi:hypothetical protein